MRLPGWLRRALGIELPKREVARYERDLRASSESVARVKESHERLKTALQIDDYAAALDRLQSDIWYHRNKREDDR